MLGSLILAEKKKERKKYELVSLSMKKINLHGEKKYFHGIVYVRVEASIDYKRNLVHLLGLRRIILLEENLAE